MMTEISAHKSFVETSFGRIAMLEAGAPDNRLLKSTRTEPGEPSGHRQQGAKKAHTGGTQPMSNTAGGVQGPPGDAEGGVQQPDKPPVLLVHGIPTSSYLWRDVMRMLSVDFHCYAPDLMGLGDTEVDPHKDLFHMEAQAEMLIELMETLGHRSFGLVCHDQGGAAAQIIAARSPDRVDCLVLTDCVCYDNWPVPAIARLQQLARLPLLTDLLGKVGILEWLQTSTPLSDFGRGVFSRDRLAKASIQEYLKQLRAGGDAALRFKRFLLAGHPRYTQLAVPGLKRFEKPTLVVWAGDDRYISPSWGRKLFGDIPGARRFELVPFCGHFWQEERPAEFTSHISEFLGEHLSQERSPLDKSEEPTGTQLRSVQLEEAANHA